MVYHRPSQTWEEFPFRRRLEKSHVTSPFLSKISILKSWVRAYCTAGNLFFHPEFRSLSRRWQVCQTSSAMLPKEEPAAADNPLAAIVAASFKLLDFYRPRSKPLYPTNFFRGTKNIGFLYPKINQQWAILSVNWCQTEVRILAITYLFYPYCVSLICPFFLNHPPLMRFKGCL